MDKLNIKAVVRLDKKNINNTYPIFIRTTIKRVVKYYNTGVMITLENFDKSKGEIIKHPNKSLLNTVLNKKINEIETSFYQANITGEKFELNNSKKNIKEIYFKNYCENIYFKNLEHKATIGTMRHKRSYLVKFLDYKPNIKLKEVTADILIGFEIYCKKIGNKETTIWSSLKFVKTVINNAVKTNTLNEKSFKGYENLIYKNPVREFLTENELFKIETYIIDKKKYWIDANWFLLACYCGLRFSDLKIFSIDNIEDGILKIRTQKTGSDITMKVHPKLQDCINRIGRNLLSNEHYNRNLKEISKELNFNKKLTSHISRHTFATLYLTKLGHLEDLQKFLGHSKIATTAIYGKIIDQRLNSEIDRVFG